MSSWRVFYVLAIVFNYRWESSISFLFLKITSKSASLIVTALLVGWGFWKLYSGWLWAGKVDFTVDFLFLCSALVSCLCYWLLDRACLLVFGAFDFFGWGARGLLQYIFVCSHLNAWIYAVFALSLVLCWHFIGMVRFYLAFNNAGIIFKRLYFFFLKLYFFSDSRRLHLFDRSSFRLLVFFLSLKFLLWRIVLSCIGIASWRLTAWGYELMNRGLWCLNLFVWFDILSFTYFQLFALHLRWNLFFFFSFCIF